MEKRIRRPLSPIQWKLQMEATRAEAQHAALLFARDCGGDVVSIRAEIADHQTMISAGEGPWMPGKSTRIYQDAYIAGLEYAIKYIEDHTSP